MRAYVRTRGRSGITREEADDLLVRFDAGDLDAFPMAVSDLDTEAITAALALTLLLAALRRSQVAGSPAGAVRFLGRSAAQRKRVALGLMDRFQRVAAGLSQANVRQWEAAMLTEVQQTLFAAAQLGRGAPLRPAQLESLNAVWRQQQARLIRFSDEVYARRLIGRAMSPKQIAARAQMYRGPMLGEFYIGRATAESRPGIVARFVGSDDARTCLPCQDAESGNPWLPSEAPVPGLVCLGGGRCRHELIFSFEPEVYRQLTGG